MSSSSGQPPGEQDQDAERVNYLPSNNSIQNIGDDVYDILLREASSIGVRGTENIPNSDMQSVLEPCDSSVLETLLQLLLQNDSSTSPGATKEPSELSVTLATESDGSALHVSDDYPGGQSTLGCSSDQQETVTSSEVIHSGHSEKALPSSIFHATSNSAQVPSRSVRDPPMPVSSSSRATISTTEQTSTPSNFQVSAAGLNNFNTESDTHKTPPYHVYESTWSEVENRSSKLSSNFGLAESGNERSHPATNMNPFQAQTHPRQPSPPNYLPTYSRDSSANNVTLDQDWLSSSGTFVGGRSFGQFHPKPAQSMSDMTPGPSSQSELPFSAGIESYLPFLRGLEHFPVDRQPETNRVNSNVENPPGNWPQNDAALTSRKRKRTPATITENNISFVLPPRKKTTRRKIAAIVSDSSTFPASGLSVPLEGHMFPVRNTSESRKSKIKKTRKTLRAKRTPTKVIVCSSGEVLPVEIIKDMLGLEYEYPDDHQFPCLFQPCTKTVSRRERNVLSHSKAHLKDDGYRNGMEIPCSHCEARCHSLHSISRHLRDHHFHSSRMSCASCDATINRGTDEVIMRHLHTQAHVNLWQQLGLRWEIRDPSEVNEGLAGDSDLEDTEGEMNKGEF
ncbi:hypothetical protein A7U60_g3512 [Sanghuangporus baumii]|uniref:C2H2-type domain-containing protein n=1 Tax=Sanghuangporus baumii TaxID=108892 RepID=A0A9Q5N6R9_SANBA|nr:hypothetical protein A7U60_g3512 [Sanghuangporus baumii]